VVAGGSGHRFGGRKQFLPLAGYPVASWSVRAARTVADGVILVVPDPALDDARDPTVPVPGATGDAALGASLVVAGGAARADSVRAGLAVVPGDASVVVVHDAARPLAGAGLFASVVGAVRSGAFDGAVPAVPLADTLKRVAGNRVVETVDRAALVAIQTPQAFTLEALQAAHAHGGDATDDAALVEATGRTVGTVPGDPRNLKLTRPEDLAVAEALLVGVAT
jgi:2-C-methyl-D-erythritol 4-phosphate cytidylyltransferase